MFLLCIFGCKAEEDNSEIHSHRCDIKAIILKNTLENEKVSNFYINDLLSDYELIFTNSNIVDTTC